MIHTPTMSPFDVAAAHSDVLLDCLVSVYHSCRALKSSNAHLELCNVDSFLDQCGAVCEAIQQQRTQKDDFEVLRVLAKGNFATVSAVRSRLDNQVYAMKVMNKQHIRKHRDRIFAMEERVVLSHSQADRKWIPKLYASFQDHENLYLVMEYAAGGDLNNILELKESLCLDEDEARFYIAEIILAVDSLHQLGYVHRDIKPQNILIDSEGHVKLADFGSCIPLSKSTTNPPRMVVGTCDYVSPDILQAQEGGSSYGTKVDWWSVGIVLYEMLQEVPPFFESSENQTYCKIMQHETSLQFNDALPLSESCKDFIRKLLTHQHKRLDIHDIKRHPFFEGLDWDNIRNMKPPLQPILISPYDTSPPTDLQEDTENSHDTFSFLHVNDAYNPLEDLVSFIGYSYTSHMTKKDGFGHSAPDPTDSPVSPSPSPPKVGKDASTQIELPKSKPVDSALQTDPKPTLTTGTQTRHLQMTGTGVQTSVPDQAIQSTDRKSVCASIQTDPATTDERTSTCLENKDPLVSPDATTCREPAVDTPSFKRRSIIPGSTTTPTVSASSPTIISTLWKNDRRSLQSVQLQLESSESQLAAAKRQVARLRKQVTSLQRYTFTEFQGGADVLKEKIPLAMIDTGADNGSLFTIKMTYVVNPRPADFQTYQLKLQCGRLNASSIDGSDTVNLDLTLPYRLEIPNATECAHLEPKHLSCVLVLQALHTLENNSGHPRSKPLPAVPSLTADQQEQLTRIDQQLAVEYRYLEGAKKTLDARARLSDAKSSKEAKLYQKDVEHVMASTRFKINMLLEKRRSVVQANANNHNFVSYSDPTAHCGSCHDTLWGAQGYQCRVCQYICHTSCMDRATTSCQDYQRLHDARRYYLWVNSPVERQTLRQWIERPPRHERGTGVQI